MRLPKASPLNWITPGSRFGQPFVPVEKYMVKPSRKDIAMLAQAVASHFIIVRIKEHELFVSARQVAGLDKDRMVAGRRWNQIVYGQVALSLLDLAAIERIFGSEVVHGTKDRHPLGPLTKSLNPDVIGQALTNRTMREQQVKPRAGVVANGKLRTLATDAILGPMDDVEINADRLFNAACVLAAAEGLEPPTEVIYLPTNTGVESVNGEPGMILVASLYERSTVTSDGIIDGYLRLTIQTNQHGEPEFALVAA